MSFPFTTLPAFPEAAFAGLFGTHRRLVAPTTESPDVFLWGSMAGALSILIGREAGIDWSSGMLYPNINIGAVGLTALSRKSTPLDDIKTTVVRPFIPPRRHPEEPESLVIIDGSGSGEGFIESIADRTWTPPDADQPVKVTGRRALLIIHELAELLAKAKRDQAGNLIEFLLGTFDARSPISHITRNKSTTITDGTVVVMAASTVDNLVRVLSTSSATSGLLNRVLWLAGDRKPPLHRRPPTNPELQRLLIQEVHAALGAVRGHHLTVTPKADALHRERYEHHYYRQAPSDLVLQATSRADVMALKIAMLLTISTGSSVISPESVLTGWEVTEYTRAVVTALVEQMPEQTFRDIEDRIAAAAARLAARNGGSFTKTHLWQNLKSKTLSYGDFERALVNVLRRGDLVPSQAEEGRYSVAPSAASGTGGPGRGS